MLSTRKKRYHLTDRVACIILAGGQGTRLFPLTKHRCKPSVGFGGRYRLIDIPISNSLNSNMKNIFIISQYFSSGLNQHIKETYPLDNFQGGSLTFLCPEERPDGKIWYEGTADAIRKNLDTLTKLPIDYFLILSGDQLYNIDFESMVKFAEEKDADITIAAIPVGNKDTSRLGLLNIDKNANIIDFHEKPSDPNVLKQFELSENFVVENDVYCANPPCFLASMGIYVFKKEVLISLLNEDNREDFGKHMIPTQIKKGKAAAFMYKGYWEDIGTISSYYNANLSLTSNQLGLNLYNEVLPIYAHNHYLPGARVENAIINNSIICDGTIIEAKEISHSIIGVRGVVKEGTIIKHSLILGNEYYLSPEKQDLPFVIGKNCLIKNAIIDENVTIGDNVRLTNEKKYQSYDSKGVFIRDGIIIIASGTSVPDNFIL